jgi:VanZ family protein
MTTLLPRLRGLMRRALPVTFAAMVLLVTLLMLVELAPSHGGWPYWDKVQHLLVFAMLTTLGCLAFPLHQRAVCLVLILYGGLIEWLQGALTITRMASFGDWFADGVGVLVMWVCFWMLKRLTAENLTTK